MSSKYTRRTGDGYQSIHSTGSGKATVSLGTVDHVDWELGEAIAALAHPDAILLQPLVTVAPEADRLGVYDVCDQGHGLNVTVGGPALRSIGMPDEVRVYAHAENALLVVDADDDPRIMTDGGSRFVRELCQDQHDTRADALRCCSEAFDDDDLDPDRALNCVDEHGSPTILTDGGQRSTSRIDPLVCPRGHHSIKLNAHRFGCETCRSQGRETTTWDRSELVDLREEEPPLADDDPVAADGGPRIQSSEEGRRKGRQSGKTDRDRHTCPKCGEEFGNLPNHLAACTGGESDD